jgi:N6-L-threonylcarbamoyladenine synthase
MKVLGIETSCDETGVCLIETQETENGTILTVLGNQLYSQVAKHQEFGGVMPMLAKREHAKNLVPLLEKCLEEAFHGRISSFSKEVSLGLGTQTQDLERSVSECERCTASVRRGNSDVEVVQKIEKILAREPELFTELQKLLERIERPKIDAIAVTNGPGLEPALWVGVTFAKALSAAWDIPLIPTNHMEGHIVVSALSPSNKVCEALPSNPRLSQGGVVSPRTGAVCLELRAVEYLIKPTPYPALALLISGGHTQLVLIKDNLQYEIIGNTCDDAVGEAFDKVARMLGLPYPGGKVISDLAKKERADFPGKKAPYPLPRPMIHSKDFNFSFSGLKTAVLYTLKKIPTLTDQIKQELSLEFENAVLDVLSSKTSQAIEKFGPQALIIGGGVSANPQIRFILDQVCQKYNIKFLVPEVSASTDNALMIALAGYMNVLAGKKSDTSFKANGNLSL